MGCKGSKASKAASKSASASGAPEEAQPTLLTEPGTTAETKVPQTTPDGAAVAEVTAEETKAFNMDAALKTAEEEVVVGEKKKDLGVEDVATKVKDDRTFEVVTDEVVQQTAEVATDATPLALELTEVEVATPVKESPAEVPVVTDGATEKQMDELNKAIVVGLEGALEEKLEEVKVEIVKSPPVTKPDNSLLGSCMQACVTKEAETEVIA